MPDIIKILQSPKIFVFSLVNMILLVFLGTIFQGDLGLYQTQKIYFSSWIHWLYIIPLPGGRLIMVVMFINLSAMLCREKMWRVSKSGIIIVHMGALMLLIGGGITAIFSYEGQMNIQEGESSNYISDYYIKEFIVIENNGKPIITDQENLYPGSKIRLSDPGFSIEIISYLENCDVIKRIAPCDDCRGNYNNFELISMPYEKEFELNHSALVFKVSDSEQSINGVYASSIYEREHNNFLLNDKSYNFILRTKRTYLPFEIELIEFTEELHPGTEIAKSYSSDVVLKKNGVGREVTISMNEPLRTGGYTFYQSSFNNTGTNDISIFAVVKNYGQLFPYISSIVMCIGLLIHLLMMLKNRKQ